ncbi:N-acetylmuramoyl-L-alanine amidase [Ligilactobacillus hayakitensis]|nr:N-acetylmuramoyl-L-alanine amidase [Ligilactobacillus hayakitensis]
MVNLKTYLLKRLDKISLGILILLLSFILCFKTVSFMSKEVIVSRFANLYPSASLEEHKLSTLKQGDRVKVLDTKFHFKQVKTDQGQIGWVGDWNFKNQNNITSLSNATIVIDPGHGGNDAGALSIEGKEEKKYTLKYAKELEQKLKKAGANVYMTRTQDKYVGLKPRPTLGEKKHADAFISIHFDSSPDENIASGYTTYYYHKKTSLKLANSINSQFKYLGIKNRGVEFGDFLVIRENKIPAVLLEMGYINSERDFDQIPSQEYINNVTTDIVKGLKNYFKSN